MEEASCYELCKTPPSFLGVTPAISPGEHGQRVLVTSATDGAQLFHAERRECLKSWSSSLEESFTSPCVFHNGRLFAVQNEKTLCSWDPQGYLSSPPTQLACGCSSSSPPPLSGSSASSSPGSPSDFASSSLSSSLLSLVSSPPLSLSSSVSTTTTSLSSVKHRSFSHPISKLYANEHHPSELILILANGAVITVSANSDPSLPAPLQLLESLMTSSLPKGKGKLISSCVNHNKDRTFVAYLRTPTAAPGSDVKTACFMSIYCIHSTQGTRKIEEVSHFGFRAPRVEDCEASLGLPASSRSKKNGGGGEENKGGGGVAPVAFDWQLHSRTIGLIWSNGVFQALKFEPVIPHLEALARAPREVYLRPLHDYHISSLSLAFIGFNFIGITGQTLTGESQLLVLETLYGTQPVPTLTLSSSSSSTSSSSSSSTSSSSSISKKRKSLLSSSSSSSSTSLFPSSSFSATVVSADGMYCFCTLSSIWVVRLPALLPSQAASLAVAVGRLKEFPALTQPPVAGRLDLLRALSQVTAVSPLNKAMDRAIKVCDEDDCALLQSLESEDAAAVETTVRKHLDGVSKGKFLSHNMINKIAARTLALRIWPAFELILQSQVFSARTLPHVVSVLIEHKQTRCLKLCVTNVHDLDEIHLVQTLQYAFDQSPTLTSLVDVVLAARHSDSFLHNALQALAQAAFAKLMAHLVHWLSAYWEATEEDVHVVTLPQVINWCNIVLDSNFVDLILPSSPCHKQIVALQQAVALHMSLASALAQPADVLKALCSSIESKRAGQKVEPEPAIPDYSVELLSL